MNILDRLGMLRRKNVPSFLAAEAAECGLACVGMIAAFHGHRVDLNWLRQRYAASIAGVTLRSVIALADMLHLSARAMRLELDSLGSVKLPAILHWDLDHFVVLVKVDRNGAVVHDPARGVRHLSNSELSAHFTGIVLELMPQAEFEPFYGGRRLRLTDLWSQSSGLPAGIIQLLGLSFALQIAAFAAPLQIQLIVDQAIQKSDTALVNVIAIAFTLLLALQIGAEALRTWTIQIFGNMLSFQIITNLFRQLLHLKITYFEKRHTGDILSRVGSISAIREALSKGVVAAIIDGAMTVIAAVILFAYAQSLALVVVLSVIVTSAITLAFLPATRSRMADQLVAAAREQSFIMESVRASTTIKLMGREAERVSFWQNCYAEYVQATMRLGHSQIVSSALQNFISGFSSIIVLYLGAKSILAGGGMSIGMLLAFVSFQRTFADRFVSFTNEAVQFALLGVHLDRIADIVTAETDNSPAAGAFFSTGQMELRNISFRYSHNDPWIIQNFNLSVRSGEFLAITGPSGGGKTTLLKLMLGLYQPTSGEILLDGLPATPALWRAWRQNLGLVAQDDQLLSGSIADNISFFDPELNMERVQRAALAASVHSQIERLPMRYMSLVGDMGSTLSGGQRQRILLARAIYRDPAILVLDEGTANLDVESEALIVESISLMPITRIAVAHRPEILRRADRVVQIGAIRSADDVTPGNSSRNN